MMTHSAPYQSETMLRVDCDSHAMLCIVFVDQAAEGANVPMEEGKQFYAFPSLEQLAEASEEALRADGYGYRAKFIVGAVRELQSHPEGGHAWLMASPPQPFPFSVTRTNTLTHTHTHTHTPLLSELPCHQYIAAPDGDQLQPAAT